MSWDAIEHNWKQFETRLMETWSRLTIQDIDMIAGKRERLVAKIQELYGVSKEDADWQVLAFDGRFGARQRRKTATA